MNKCLHDDVYIDDFEVISSTGVGNGEDIVVTLRCYKCGDSQQRTLCIDNLLYDLYLEWEE